MNGDEEKLVQSCSMERSQKFNQHFQANVRTSIGRVTGFIECFMMIHWPQKKTDNRQFDRQLIVCSRFSSRYDKMYDAIQCRGFFSPFSTFSMQLMF